MAGPPASNELRAKRVGHALINMTTEPWSQYYCCVLISSKEFVRQYPVAKKRALRAIMKGADICAAEPKRVARLLADKGLARYEYTLQTHQEIPYGRWRDYDIEDTVRFFALRMSELGLIKFTPQRIIAEGTDWRFLKRQEKNSRRDRPRKGKVTICTQRTRYQCCFAVLIANRRLQHLSLNRRYRPAAVVHDCLLPGG